MKIHKKLHLGYLISTVLILFLIFVSSTASAATTTCDVKGINYQYWSSEQYPSIDLFREEYVPLRDNAGQIWNSHVDKPSKLVTDSKDIYDLKEGESLYLGDVYCDHYSLQVKQVDVDGQKVWLEFFDKHGQYVGDQIISINSGDDTWNRTLDNIQGINSVPIFKVHINQVFQGATDITAQIQGIRLIDYKNSMTLQIGDQFGDYRLKKIINGVDAFNPGSLVFESG